jgi:hypothetical protein
MPIAYNLGVLLLALTAGVETSPLPRVRSSHPYIRAMIVGAQERSATFHRLVQAFESTDGIIYVEEGDCHFAVRACLPPTITAAAGYRYLEAIIDARQEDWQVMSDIGHELQHALEVLDNPGTRTSDDAVALLLRHKSFSGTNGIFETDDAVKAGEDVRREVKAFARSSTTKGRSRPTAR